MLALCVVCEKEGLEEMRGDEGFIRYLKEWGITWECKTLMERDVRKWRKDVCTWCVILMEDG
jgi:hypothetical protein